MKAYRAWILSPAIPASLLLFGLTFGFAIFYFAGLNWVPTVTRTYYLGVFCWGCIILIVRRNFLRQLGLIDYLFLAFWLLVSMSLAFQHSGNPIAAYYARMLPFFVLMPYCLGRVMETNDFQYFVRPLPWLAVLLLILSAVDIYWLQGNKIVSERWKFFGVNHSPALIAFMVSCAILVVVYQILEARNGSLRFGNLVKLGMLGILTVALVLIAVRGALIACTLSLVFAVLLMKHSASRKLFLLIYFSILAVSTIHFLPTQQAEFYTRLKTVADVGANISPVLSDQTQTPSAIDSASMCKPLTDGFNSVAIRFVLFQEAVNIFWVHPLVGVGATRFGNFSCGGTGSYPHSTILQAFAELGILGGAIILVIFAISILSVTRIYMLAKPQGKESIFWGALIIFFMLIDQIYGNYFMACGFYFSCGTIQRYVIRSNTATA